MSRPRQRRSMVAGGMALVMVVGVGCGGGDDMDLEGPIETPGPGLDEGEDLPAVEGDQGETDNFDPDVDVESGVQGVDD